MSEKIKGPNTSPLDRVQPVSPGSPLVEKLPPVRPHIDSAVQVELGEDLQSIVEQIRERQKSSPGEKIKIFFIASDEDIGYDARGKKKKKGKKALVWTLADFREHAEEHGLTDWTIGADTEVFLREANKE